MQLKTIFFSNPSELRKWFAKNHDSVPELWVGYYKKDSGKPSINYPESVDEALCFGWIDGVRYSIDAESYKIRFTLRKPKSYWSEVNRKRMKELIRSGRAHPAGIAVFEKRDDANTNRYSFERKNVKLTEEYAKQFRKNKKAWDFFLAQVPSYQKPALWWVMSAKQEETRIKRLEILIKDSAAGRKI